MVFFPHSLRNQHQQHHTTAQNASKQLAQCSFDHICSCMDPVLFSNVVTETRTVDDVGQGFHEVGRYGKTCLYSLWIPVVKSAVRIWIGLDGFFPSLTSQPTPAAPHNRTKYQQTTCAMQSSPCVFLHGFCPVFQHAERDTYSRLCWSKFSIRLAGTLKLVCFLCEFWWWKMQFEYGCVWIVFWNSLHHQHQQHHTNAQNASKQLAQCNFHHVCSCMGSVLFSKMLKETHAADYVGQSFPEVGWYGKTCLFSLWTLVVKSAVRIWIGLDGFFPHSLRNQHQQHHTTAQNTSKQLAQCNFHHVCSCRGSVLFSNMLKETHTVDYVGQSFQ